MVTLELGWSTSQKRLKGTCKRFCSMIVKKGSKYQVRSKSGDLLGTHGSRKEALAQLRAIEASKARRS
jgi:hypothetical protein